MNRRSFLSGLGALVGGLALEQAVPFGRVWSFPTDLAGAARRNQGCTLLTVDQITREALSIFEREFRATQGLGFFRALDETTLYGSGYIRCAPPGGFPPGTPGIIPVTIEGPEGWQFPENSPEISE